MQIHGVQYHKDATDRFCSQGVHQLRRNGREQCVALLTARVQFGQIELAFFLHGKNGIVDVLRQIGQILCILHQVLHVADAVAHLHVEHVLGVLVQPAVHIGNGNADCQQHHLHQRHQHHGVKNGAEDRPACFFAPGGIRILLSAQHRHHLFSSACSVGSALVLFELTADILIPCLKVIVGQELGFCVRSALTLGDALLHGLAVRSGKVTQAVFQHLAGAAAAHAAKGQRRGAQPGHDRFEIFFHRFSPLRALTQQDVPATISPDYT